MFLILGPLGIDREWWVVGSKTWVRLALMIKDRIIQRIEEIDHVWVLSGVPHVGVWV